MSTEYVIDPATGDLVEDDEGWFLETDTAAPRVYAQLALRFGQWWGDPQAGSRLHEATAFGDSPAGERFLESEVRRALEPLILAGDFNDWNGRLDPILVKALDVTSSLSRLTRKQGASFPNLRPFLALDRLFWRGLDVDHLRVLRGEPWSRISDHLPLEATLTFV